MRGRERRSGVRFDGRGYRCFRGDFNHRRRPPFGNRGGRRAEDCILERFDAAIQLAQSLFDAAQSSGGRPVALVIYNPGEKNSEQPTDQRAALLSDGAAD